jgi:hypothetical protein
VLIGLHAASVHGDVGLRIEDAAAATDISVMHGYSVYDPLARWPLDPELVPFTAALTAELAERPILYEEFGVNTSLPDGPSRWETRPTWNGGETPYFVASEADAAAYYDAVLHRLHDLGCFGAFAWCFGDYSSALWDRPPCDLQPHERSFGLYRSDGTLKPMGAVMREFARTQPMVREPMRPFSAAPTPDEFYADPERHLPNLYEEYLGAVRSTA